MTCPKRKKTIWRFLEKLQQLLPRLEHERRSKILRSLNEAQRRDLERWMLEYKSGQPKTLHGPVVATPVRSAMQGTRCRKRSDGAGKGVLSRRRYGTWRYFAVVVVHRLQLRSKEVHRSHLAAKHHALLLEIKQEIAADLCAQRLRQKPDEALASRLHHKVASVMQKFQLNSDDLGLQFRAVIPIIGTVLSGPVFHLRSFHLGIAGWQFLQLARGVERPSSVEEVSQAWDRSRHAFSELWAVAGRSPAESARRLDDLEKRHSFEELQKRRAIQQQRRQDKGRRAQMERLQRQQERLEERIHQLLMKFRSFRR